MPRDYLEGCEESPLFPTFPHWTPFYPMYLGDATPTRASSTTRKKPGETERLAGLLIRSRAALPPILVRSPLLARLPNDLLLTIQVDIGTFADLCLALCLDPTRLIQGR